MFGCGRRTYIRLRRRQRKIPALVESTLTVFDSLIANEKWKITSISTLKPPVVSVGSLMASLTVGDAQTAARITELIGHADVF